MSNETFFCKPFLPKYSSWIRYLYGRYRNAIPPPFNCLHARETYYGSCEYTIFDRGAKHQQVKCTTENITMHTHGKLRLGWGWLWRDRNVSECLCLLLLPWRSWVQSEIASNIVARAWDCWESCRWCSKPLAIIIALIAPYEVVDVCSDQINECGVINNQIATLKLEPANTYSSILPLNRILTLRMLYRRILIICKLSEYESNSKHQIIFYTNRPIISKQWPYCNFSRQMGTHYTVNNSELL